MGLDTYAYHGTRNEPLSDGLFLHIPPVMVGGLFSGGGGSNSFRGKVYAPWLMEVVQADLYREELSPTEVNGLAHALQDYMMNTPDKQLAATCRKYNMVEAEARALCEWFAVVAQHNGRVVGWW